MRRRYVDTATWMTRVVEHGIADRLNYRHVTIPYAPRRSIGMVILTAKRPPRHDHPLRDLGQCLRRAVLGPIR